jgi:predicted Zn-dependent protease
MRIRMSSLALCVLAAAGPLAAADDVVMKAMRDELVRSTKQLQLEKLEKPYFVAYRVTDSDGTGVSASFGALEQSSQNRGRMLGVEVRVGSYQLDNSNFFSPNFNFSSIVSVFNGAAQLTVEDDYKELRRQIWLATDATYKKAVEDISKKRAALENKNREGEPPDFSKEEPATTTEEVPAVHIDRAKWEAMARSLSALFRQMPDVNTSGISFNANNTYTRYVNSEGTSYTRRRASVSFNARAATQAADGGQLDDFVWLHGRALADLPGETELAAKVKDLGQRLKELRAAATLENYNGPVLAEGEAAAQLFRLHFVPDLLGRRSVISDMPGYQQNASQAENPFIDKIGARVLPEFLTVTDNPTLPEYQGRELGGWCRVDDDGIPTRQTTLVEKGILKTLLMSRDPVRGIEHSTGSRHLGQASPTNIFVTAENGLTQAELRAKFLDLVKQRNKEFGIVVRRMRNANSPVMAYKLFLDGHEELIRGVQFSGLNLSAFKEIVAASKDQNILTVQYWPPRNNMAAFSPVDNGSMAVSLAVPSLLFEDVTVRKARGEIPNPPVTTHPFFSK